MASWMSLKIPNSLKFTVFSERRTINLCDVASVIGQKFWRREKREKKKIEREKSGAERWYGCRAALRVEGKG